MHVAFFHLCVSVLHNVFLINGNISKKYCMNIILLETSQLWSIIFIRYHHLYHLKSAVTSETERHWRNLMWASCIMWDLKASKKALLSFLYCTMQNKNTVVGLSIYKAFSFIAIANGSLKHAEYCAGVDHKRTYKICMKINFGSV